MSNTARKILMFEQIYLDSDSHNVVLHHQPRLDGTHHEGCRCGCGLDERDSSSELIVSSSLFLIQTAIWQSKLIDLDPDVILHEAGPMNLIPNNYARHVSGIDCRKTYHSIVKRMEKKGVLSGVPTAKKFTLEGIGQFVCDSVSMGFTTCNTRNVIEDERFSKVILGHINLAPTLG